MRTQAPMMAVVEFIFIRCSPVGTKRSRILPTQRSGERIDHAAGLAAEDTVPDSTLNYEEMHAGSIVQWHEKGTTSRKRGIGVTPLMIVALLTRRTVPLLS